MSSSKNQSTIAIAGAAVAAAATVAATAAARKYKKGLLAKPTITTLLLAGDIGGTNTRLAIYAPDSKEPLYSKEYLNSEYIHTGEQRIETEIVEPFLQDYISSTSSSYKEIQLHSCFAVAGPVFDNAVQMTNLVSKHESLVIEFNGTAIEESTVGMLQCIKSVLVINDFVGQGYGILDLNHEKETIELTPDSTNMMIRGGPKVVIGAGTGLGQCFLTVGNEHGDYTCYASEGGHVDYTPRSQLEFELLKYLKDKYSQTLQISNQQKPTRKSLLSGTIDRVSAKRISAERVVSGKGLANVYQFLSEKYPKKVNRDVHEEFQTAGDMQGRVVGVNANNGNCELCHEAMELMMGAYGAKVGDCAISFIPHGGLYVTGGLTPKNIDFIQGANTVFHQAYWDKGRVSEILKSIPLFAVMVEDLGLRGARICAAREYKKAMNSQA